MSKQKRQARRAARKENRAEKKASGTRAVDKAKKAVKNTVQNVGELARNMGESAALAPLVPFSLGMRTIIKAKGVKPEEKLGDLATQFYNIVVKKEGVHSFDFDATSEMITKQQVAASLNGEHLAADIVASLIGGIVKYFKGINDTPDDQLSPAEIEAKRQVEKNLEVMASSDENKIAGMPITTVLIGLLGLAVLTKLASK